MMTEPTQPAPIDDDIRRQLQRAFGDYSGFEGGQRMPFDADGMLWADDGHDLFTALATLGYQESFADLYDLERITCGQAVRFVRRPRATA